MGNTGTLMDPENLEIPALATTMVTFQKHRIAQTVRSLVLRVSFRWVAPMETNRNNQESVIVAKES